MYVGVCLLSWHTHLAAPPPHHVPGCPSLQGASGEITPEECPSPPPTPTEERRLHEQAEAAAEVAEAAPAPVAPTQPPRLLTPSDLLQSASTSSATTGRRSPAGAAGGAAAAPLAAAAEPAAAQEQEEPLASPPAVPAAAPAAAASQLDEAAVAAAVAEAMGGVHKKFVGHVSLMYRELLKVGAPNLPPLPVKQKPRRRSCCRGSNRFATNRTVTRAAGFA